MIDVHTVQPINKGFYERLKQKKQALVIRKMLIYPYFCTPIKTESVAQ